MTISRFSCREALERLLGSIEILGELRSDPELHPSIVSESIVDLVRMGTRFQNDLKREKDKPPWEE